MKKKIQAIAGLLALLTIGCATHVDGLRADPSFTYETATATRIAIGGVTAARAPLAKATASAYASIMETRIRDERHAYDLISAGAVTLAMGGKSYQKMVEQFRHTAALDRSTLAHLTDSGDSWGYVALARIDRNDLSRKKESHDLYEETGTEPKTRTVTGTEHITLSRREMTVIMTIYDLKTARPVWGGAITQAIVEKNSYTVQNNVVAQVVDLLGKMEGDEKETYPYPPYPSEEKLLKHIFDGFVENLPKK